MPELHIETAPDLTEVSDSFSVSSSGHSTHSFSKKDDLQYQESENDIDERIDENKVVNFTVRGVYQKWYPTDEEEESGKKEFICCRYRMRTRPLENPPKTNFTKERDSDFDVSSKVDSDIGKSKEDNSSDIDDSSESDQQKEYETAMFVPKKGLVDGYFWHEYDEEAKETREDRAILFQSQENYEHLRSHELFKSCFEDIDYMKNPTFGEQVIVSGVDTTELAIGDIFEIEGGHSPLKVEITAPRKPCSYMNQKHGSKYGLKGIAHYSHHNVLAGWFARVLVAGELRDGMTFVRKEHPNPKWTLNYIYKALYGEGTLRQWRKNTSSWNRGKEELNELISLPQLCEYEWKAEARKQLFKLKGVNWKKVRKDRIDPQIYVPNYFFELFRINIILETITAALTYFGIF